MPAKALQLWLIDDSESNHQTAINTVAEMPWVTLRCFFSGAQAIEEFSGIENAPESESSPPAPSAVLMDYYLVGERGDHITRALRACERRSRPTIIGYSSVNSASEAIVRAGADMIVRKYTDGRGQNPSLAEWLRAQC